MTMYIAFNKSGKSFTRTTNREYEYAIFTGTTRNRTWENTGEYQSDDFTDRMAGRIDLAEKVQAELNKLGYVDAYIAPVEAIQIEKAAPKQWEATADGRTITATTKKELIEMIDNGAFDRPEETPVQEVEAEEAPVELKEEDPARTEACRTLMAHMDAVGMEDEDVIMKDGRTYADFKESLSHTNTRTIKILALAMEGCDKEETRDHAGMLLMANAFVEKLTGGEWDETADLPKAREVETDVCGTVKIIAGLTEDKGPNDGAFSVSIVFDAEHFKGKVGDGDVTSSLTTDKVDAMNEIYDKLGKADIEAMFFSTEKQIEELTDE